MPVGNFRHLIVSKTPKSFAGDDQFVFVAVD
ncbi:MAG: hypothetical protein RL710_1449, partial [Pseudomonadota bacterium]